jgi:hypothetical protein
MEFDTVVQDGGGGGARVSLPAEAAEVFGTRARFAVRASFNGVDYRGSTMPMGDGTFCVGLTKAVRAAAHVDVGDQVHVVVALDSELRTVDVPADLAAALETALLTGTFNSPAYTHRKEYVRWIVEAKKSETRQKRLARAIEMIAAGDRLS